MTTHRLHPGKFVALLIAVGVVLSAAASYWRGQDVNFDQLNYHFYIAYAHATDRMVVDVLAAQVMHSYLSPYLYMPFYFMVRHLSPPVVGIVMGSMHGLNLVLVAIIAWLVIPAFPKAERATLTLIAIVISSASPMALSELGTSMADIVISIPVLAGLALLMRAKFPNGRPSAASIGLVGLAGAFVGVATSLKLTGAAFAVGLAATAMAGWLTWRHRLMAVLAIVLGETIGFATAGGWYLRLWQTFRNPVFPYYNTLFGSPDYQQTEALFDARYIPQGVLNAIAYPFYWIGIQRTTSEELFRDIRFATLIGIGVIALAVRLTRRHGPQNPVMRSTPAQQRLLLFFAIAFCIWMYEWSIQRYLVALELLTGPTLIVLLLWTGALDQGRRWALSLTAIIATACALTVKVPDWSHIAWGKDWYQIHVPPAGGEHPIYFLDDEPLAYVVPSLPPGSTAVGVVAREPVPSWGNTIFLRRIRKLIADPNHGPILAIARKPLSDSFKVAIAEYGLKPNGECQTTPGRPEPLIWCHLVTLSPTCP